MQPVVGVIGLRELLMSLQQQRLRVHGSPQLPIGQPQHIGRHGVAGVLREHGLRDAGRLFGLPLRQEHPGQQQPLGLAHEHPGLVHSIEGQEKLQPGLKRLRVVRAGGKDPLCDHLGLQRLALGEVTRRQPVLELRVARIEAQSTVERPGLGVLPSHATQIRRLGQVAQTRHARRKGLGPLQEGTKQPDTVLGAQRLPVQHQAKESRACVVRGPLQGLGQRAVGTGGVAAQVTDLGLAEPIAEG